MMGLGAALTLGIHGMALGQQLDGSCTVTVNGQSVQVDPNGSFTISNVSAPDVFGPGRAGTGPARRLKRSSPWAALMQPKRLMSA